MRRTAGLIAFTLWCSPVLGEEPGDQAELYSSAPIQAEANAVDVNRAMQRAAEARSEEFGRTIYAFCQDDDFDPKWIPDAKKFCRVFDASTETVCPQAAQMCRDRSSFWSTAGAWLPSLPPAVGWLLLAVLVGLLVAALLTALKKGEWATDPVLDLGDAIPAVDLDELQSLPEAPSQKILSLARRALTEQKLEAAATLLQLAMLRYFDDFGLVTFHPSLTNGDYLRRIRRHRELHATYRNVSIHTNRLRFGDGVIDATKLTEDIDRVATVIAKAPTRQPPSSGAAAVASTLILGLFIGGCGDSQRAFRNPLPNGLQALRPLLEAAEMKVELSREEFLKIPKEAGVVVLLTSSVLPFGDLKLDALLDRDLTVVVIDDGHRAHKMLPVTLTSTRGGDNSPTPISIELAERRPCNVGLSEIALSLGAGDSGREAAIRLPRGTRMRLAEGRDGKGEASDYEMTLTPMLFYAGSDHDEDATLAYNATRTEYEEIMNGCLFVFSSEDMFTNASVTRSPNAQFVAGFFASLLRNQDEAVYLMETWDTGAKEESITRSIGEAKLLPVVAQMLFWLAATLVFVGAAFGPLRDPVRVEHKAFVEHVEAIGRHYNSAGKAGLTHAAIALARALVQKHRTEARAGTGQWVSVARHLAGKYELEENDVRAALRLGIEGTSELGTPGLDDPEPASEKMLQTLSTLMSSRTKR